MLSQLSQRDGIEVWIYNKAGCSYFNLRWPNADTSPDCARFALELKMRFLEALTEGDVLFLPSLRLQRFGDQWGPFSDDLVQRANFGPAVAEARSRAIGEAITYLRPLAEKGVRIIFEAPKPIFRAPAFRCSDWFNKSNRVCEAGTELPADLLRRYRQPTINSINVIIDTLPRTEIWDPFPLLCPGDKCSLWRENKPLFFDGDHLSGYGQLTLYASFSRLLRQVRSSR